MGVKLLYYWDRLRSTFWFVPAVMASIAILLAFSAVAVDAEVGEEWLNKQSWIYAGGPEGASAVLGAIAGSMITIAGVVFSLTLVALSLASSQFGSRLLRNFMRDTINQVVLGAFAATFLYCLLVLRTIRRGDGSEFVPHISVTLGILAAVASIGVLIYFIHHVSVSIQADELITRVNADLTDAIKRLFPEKIGQSSKDGTSDKDKVSLPEFFDLEAAQVMADGDGYLQAIDAEGLMELAVEEDLLVRLELRPGHYVVAKTPLASVWPGKKLNDDLASKINKAIIRGTQRTPVQDVEYAVNQLVEIAVRALSPGVNDPFTAIACVDRLSSGLSRLAQRDIPSPYRRDEKGNLRVIALPFTFAAVTDAAFNQIRQDARTNAAVTIRLLEAIATIASQAARLDDRAALRRHAEMILRGSREGLPEEEDRKAVQERFDEVMENLK